MEWELVDGGSQSAAFIPVPSAVLRSGSEPRPRAVRTWVSRRRDSAAEATSVLTPGLAHTRPHVGKLCVWVTF